MGYSEPGRSGLSYLRGSREGEYQTVVPKQIVGMQYSDVYKDELRKGSERAESFYAGAGKSIIGGNYGGGVKFGEVKSGFESNGNPIYMKGMTTVTMPDGQSLKIPNALAQQLQYTSYINEGRYDPLSFFKQTKNDIEGLKNRLGINSVGQVEGGVNFDWTVWQEKMNRMAEAKGLTGEGYFSRWKEVRDERESLRKEIEGIRSGMGFVREEKMVGGQRGGESVNASKEYDDRLRELMSRKERLDAEWSSGKRWDNGIDFSEFEKIGGPTASNMEIKEKII